MKRTTKILASLFAAAAVTLVAPVLAFADDISTMSAQSIVEDMKVGWNLGNSLDSHNNDQAWTADETSWGNPATTKAMIDAVKAKGFNAVRIPVTWYDKCDSNGNISSEYMARVKEVVNYAYNNGMYVILDTHHEGSRIVPDASHKEASKQFLVKLWSQIAPAFKEYDRHLIFEVLNEPRIEGSGEEWTTGSYETRVIISEFEQAALDTIRATGGNNSTRLVMCPSNAAKIPATTGFTLPDDDNVVLSVHNYSPYEFAMNENGTSVWGSDSDKAALTSEIKELYNRYVSKGTPVIIGEMGATNKNNDAERAEWAEFYTNTAAKYGITCVVWDNNEATNSTRPYYECFGLFNRSTLGWYASDVADALVRGAGTAEKIEPSVQDPYSTELWSGSETKSSYDTFVVTESLPDISAGDKIAVEYSGKAPRLCIHNYKIGGSWSEVYPDSADGSVAYYSYNSIMSACKISYSQMNQMLLMAEGADVTVTKVSVIAANKTGDVNNDGNVDKADSAVILKYLCGITTVGASMEYANANGVAYINILDAIKVLQS